MDVVEASGGEDEGLLLPLHLLGLGVRVAGVVNENSNLERGGAMMQYDMEGRGGEGRGGREGRGGEGRGGEGRGGEGRGGEGRGGEGRGGEGRGGEGRGG